MISVIILYTYRLSDGTKGGESNLDESSFWYTRLMLMSGFGVTSRSIRQENPVFALVNFVDYFLLAPTKGFEALTTRRSRADSRITTIWIFSGWWNTGHYCPISNWYDYSGLRKNWSWGCSCKGGSIKIASKIAAYPSFRKKNGRSGHCYWMLAGRTHGCRRYHDD